MGWDARLLPCVGYPVFRQFVQGSILRMFAHWREFGRRGVAITPPVSPEIGVSFFDCVARIVEWIGFIFSAVVCDAADYFLGRIASC
jgi:hypothetical protein